MTPTAIAVTFNDLPGFVADESSEGSDEKLAIAGEGEDERAILVCVVEGFWEEAVRLSSIDEELGIV